MEAIHWISSSEEGGVTIIIVDHARQLTQRGANEKYET